MGGTSVSPVILAAGRGTRFGSDRPKCLAEVAGRPLLAHSLSALAEAGFDQVDIVVGHRADAISEWLADAGAPLKVRLLHNPQYARPSIHSLHCAITATEGALLIIEGDLLFDSRIVGAMRHDTRANVVPCGPRVQPK